MIGFGTMLQMAQATNSVLLYAALLLLAAAVITLSIVVLKLIWRERQARSAPQQAQDSRAVGSSQDNDTVNSADLTCLEGRRTAASGHEFTQRDYPPPRDKLHYRLRYEPIGRFAKEKRLKAGQDRQNVRLALSSLAHRGTYVFEDLMTEQGAIDFLTLSRTGVNLVFVWTDEGYVWRDPSTDLIMYGEYASEVDPETGYKNLWGDPLPENPDVVTSEIVRAYHTDVGVVRGEGSWTTYCFTRAEIQRLSEYTNDPRGMSATIDLASWIDWKDESEFTITEDRVHELAAITEEVYSRKPIVRPLEVESGP